jgi:hypothetical protein
MDRKEHWQRVYTTNASDTVGWFQPVPTVSVRLLEAAGFEPHT